ncbi:conserved phage C-terminal domain-containing protein [Clostridium ganghwense]|uniref:Conserved phage C-terminal domain-containing protein n=1 Tax=Clostridium ganghwense TaxID=312089 RepID=A0ABT4CT37_9CLOT|nr:conserved phage C-terminal domain-containing protein [Clostridium ganghwense]MCY6372235.1 conserved phage C-terminal domain-containing protein [Clostridium ganghwense]
MSGYIKDYRKELHSEIWYMPPLYHRVWQFIKYRANHEKCEIPMMDGDKLLIKRGQYLTSYRNIAKGVGWYEKLRWKEPNPKTIKRVCEWMIKKNMISINHGIGNRQYTLITIVNWELYQNYIYQGNSKETQRKQSLDINKKNKECIKNNIPYFEIIDYLNKRINSNYKHNSKLTCKCINARWKDGYRLNDFKKVIDIKVEEWLGEEKMAKYLRPDTLFGSKFEIYLNQTEVKVNEKKINASAYINEFKEQALEV